MSDETTKEAREVVQDGVELADEHGQGHILLCGDDQEDILEALETEFGIGETGGVLTQEDLDRIRGEAATIEE